MNDSLRNHRAYVAFWFVRVFSMFAFQMLSVAAGWQIYALTESALQLGMLGLVQFLPSVLLALPAGHLADQLDRRRVVLFGQTIECSALVTLAVITLVGWERQGLLLSLLFLISVGRALGGPSMQSMLPALIPKSILPKAMAANASAVQAAMILGPALGGLLSVAGAGFVYATSALLSLASIALITRLRYESTPPRREPATLKSVFAGILFIRARPDVLGVISLDLFAVLLGGATALLPIFAKDVLHAGSSGFGLLRAAPGVGALLMSFWLARNSLQQNVGRTMFASVAGFGVATIVFALSKVLWLSLVALCLLGAFDMVSMVIRGSLVQLDTPDDMRGRVSAVNSIFISASNQLGEFESGLLAAWIGVVPAAVFGGIGTIAVVLAWIYLFPSLRSRQRLHAGEG